MEENEKKVPLSTAVRMLGTGFEWESGLFVETYRELCKHMPKEEARKIIGKAMYRTGVRLGKEAQTMTEKRGPLGMAEAWDVIYGMGTQEADQLSEERFIIHANGCAAYHLMKRWGLTDEEIQFIGQAYCSGDVGQANGFDEKMNFQHTCRLMFGNDYCVWDYSSTPQIQAEAKVKEELFKE
jgi:hypothetical protein